MALGRSNYVLCRLSACKARCHRNGGCETFDCLNAIAGFFSPLLAVISLTAGLVIATLMSLILYLLRRMTMKSLLPLGPYLLLGFFLSVGPSAFFIAAEVLS